MSGGLCSNRQNAPVREGDGCKRTGTQKKSLLARWKESAARQQQRRLLDTLTRQKEREEEALASATKILHCHLDTPEYSDAQARRALRDRIHAHRKNMEVLNERIFRCQQALLESGGSPEMSDDKSHNESHGVRGKGVKGESLPPSQNGPANRALPPARSTAPAALMDHSHPQMTSGKVVVMDDSSVALCKSRQVAQEKPKSKSIPTPPPPPSSHSPSLFRKKHHGKTDMRGATDGHSGHGNRISPVNLENYEHSELMERRMQQQQTTWQVGKRHNIQNQSTSAFHRHQFVYFHHCSAPSSPNPHRHSNHIPEIPSIPVTNSPESDIPKRPISLPAPLLAPHSDSELINGLNIGSIATLNTNLNVDSALKTSKNIKLDSSPERCQSNLLEPSLTLRMHQSSPLDTHSSNHHCSPHGSNSKQQQSLDGLKSPCICCRKPMIRGESGAGHDARKTNCSVSPRFTNEPTEIDSVQSEISDLEDRISRAQRTKESLSELLTTYQTQPKFATSKAIVEVQMNIGMLEMDIRQLRTQLLKCRARLQSLIDEEKAKEKSKEKTKETEVTEVTTTTTTTITTTTTTRTRKTTTVERIPKEDKIGNCDPDLPA